MLASVVVLAHTCLSWEVEVTGEAWGSEFHISYAEGFLYHSTPRYSADPHLRRGLRGTPNP